MFLKVNHFPHEKKVYVIGEEGILEELELAGFTALGGPQELEDEMRRLKLELKQTMEMYYSACKEALNAKQKAREIDQWKSAEARRLEEGKEAEEVALAMVEMEKQKCKAAMEAAQMAQRLADLESQKRKNAETKAKHEAEEKKKATDVATN